MVIQEAFAQVSGQSAATSEAWPKKVTDGVDGLHFSRERSAELGPGDREGRVDCQPARQARRRIRRPPSVRETRRNGICRCMRG